MTPRQYMRSTRYACTQILALALTAVGLLSACANTSAMPEAPSTQDTRITTLINRIKHELVALPGGTFDMGDWGDKNGLPYDAEKNARPLHKVTLDGFSIMAYKVTYDDFDLFTTMTEAPRIDVDAYGIEQRSPRKPAGVNWHGAKAYCEWLGKLTNLPFDLPTEAQWEYAARSGGKKLLFATDNGQIDSNRNFPNDWDLKDRRTPDVGSYPPNPAGLYGMLDHRASEWVNDWYDPDYYQSSPERNPQGPVQGKSPMPNHPEMGAAKVLRGHSSPGNNPALGGFVFSRGAAVPRTLGLDGMTPRPGFSGKASTQFRCAVNATQLPR
jgi:sulfatase modifying factor 1